MSKPAARDLKLLPLRDKRSDIRGADSRPFRQRFQVSVLVFLESGIDGEVGFKTEMQRSLVLKFDREGLGILGDKELNLFCHFALHQRKLDKTPVGKGFLLKAKRTGGE